MSMVVFINRFLSGAIALSYLSMAEALTPAGSFYAFAAISLVSIFFYALCVPETRGKTLEQVRYIQIILPNHSIKVNCIANHLIAHSQY